LRFGVLGTTLASLAFAASARAETLRVSYEAPAGCPDRTGAQAIVVRRTSAVLVDPAEVGAFTRITIEAAAEGQFAGTLLSPDADGVPRTRTISGASCAEVIDALAVIAAVHATPDTNEEQPSPVTPPAPSRGADAPRVPAPPPRSSTEFAVGIQGGLLDGPMPTAAPRGEIVASFGVRPPDGGFVHVAPRDRLSVGLSKTSKSISGFGTDFTLIEAGLDACPLRFGGKALGVSPCLRTEVGSLSAGTDDFVGARSRSGLWLALGGLAVATANVAPALDIELYGGIMTPLQKDRFFVEPSTTVQSVASVAVVGGAGVGVSIW
jgi:hypothetical protein